MGEFRVHHVRFMEYIPKAVHCMAYNDATQRLAVSRSDGSIEIWSIQDNWFQEKVIQGNEDRSVEAIVWAGTRLFTAGLHGEITEYDLLRLVPKKSVSCNNGAVWCMSSNKEQTRLAAGTEDGCAVIFNIEGGDLEYERALDKQEGRILSVAWYDQENFLVTGGIDNIRIWSIASGHAIQRLTLGRQEGNKDTIVWCITVTDDFTIISGDSRGKTCFWNGKQGTLIKSNQSHKADVLALCVNKEGTSVFCSGVDPTLVQFEYTATQPDSDWKMWVRSSVRTQHSHDVRAVAFAEGCVVSGGVDCNLIFNNLEGKEGIKVWKRLPAIPHRRMVQTVPEANSVMLQYRNYLELWRLGKTSRSSDKNGDILPLNTNPMKLVQLQSKGGETIVCSAITKDGKWIAYCDTDKIRLYSLTIEECSVVNPKLSMQRVRHSPSNALPAHLLAFTPDGATLLSATNAGSLQVISTDLDEPSLLHTFTNPTGLSEAIHLLAVSADGKFVATADHAHDVHIYSLEKKKHMCSMPRYKTQPSAMAFCPHSGHLLVAYCDQKILEYNVQLKQYTPWCRENQYKFHPQWLKRQSKINQISFNPDQPNDFLVADDHMLCIIDRSKQFPGPNVRLFNKSRKAHEGQTFTKRAFHTCNKYKFLLHLDALKDGYLLVVERTPMAISDSLPPALRLKKFGT